MILSCDCNGHPQYGTAGARFQDALYGAGRRVHTSLFKEPGGHCTVCGTHNKPAQKAKKATVVESGKKGKKR